MGEGTEIAERPADVLFRPLRIGPLTVPNRIVMAPMTRSFGQPDGTPNPDSAAYYRRRAAGGVGLILSEGTVIDRPGARNDPGIPHFHGRAALARWADIAAAVHDAGGRMGPQIWHCGAWTNAKGWDEGVQPESPSGLLAPGQPVGRAMTDADIADTIAAFADAARAARDLGFDMVELHGAHGYLIDQFFWSGTNQRPSPYGGPAIHDRVRFAVDIITAVRAAVGADFPIGIRLSQWKLHDYAARIAATPDEMLEWIGPLVDAGVDILHCSQRRFWEPEFPEIDGAEGLNFAGWAKKLTGAVTISVGSVGLDTEFIASLWERKPAAPSGIDGLIARMERDEFDMIAVGRALLSDPEWAEKVRSGRWGEIADFSVEALRHLY